MDVRLSSPRIGDVRQVPVGEIAPGWVLLDGATLKSDEWPEFVRAMSITDATFQLPQPERVREGYSFVIHLGRQVQPAPPIMSLSPAFALPYSGRPKRPGHMEVVDNG